ALAVRGLHLGIAHDAHRAGDVASDYVIRGILGVDAATGAIAVGDEVEVGAVVRLHLRDADSADADLRSMTSAVGDVASGAYLFTCNGRGSAMFTSPDHDAAVLREGLGTPQVGGFFAAGEIGPVGGANHLHGFTAVVLVVDPIVVKPDVEVARDHVGDGAEALDLDAELRALLGP
ncbi:MAG: FIST C-terminal domain-containing protein, partial [Actinomycetota bacterium]